MAVKNKNTKTKKSKGVVKKATPRVSELSYPGWCTDCQDIVTAVREVCTDEGFIYIMCKECGKVFVAKDLWETIRRCYGGKKEVEDEYYVGP